MASLMSSSRQTTWLVLVCISILLLAWAMPLLIDALQDALHDQRVRSNQAADPIDSPSSLWDVTDEPFIWPTLGGVAMPRLTHSFQPIDPTARAWSPRLPIRPPIVLHSI